MRTTTRLALVAILVAGAVAAQGFPLWQTTTPLAPSDGYGWAVAIIGDINGDGKPEVAVGAPSIDCPFIPTPATYVLVLSGADGSTIHIIPGSSPTDHFGFAIAGIGDVTGDGVPDLAIGAPSNLGSAGVVKVVSGATGALVRTLTLPGSTSDNLGAAIAPAGDADGDGVPDILVGAPLVNNQNGQALIFSGATGVVHRTFTAPAGSWRLGTSVASIGDVNNDGTSDIVAGSPGAFTPLNPGNGTAVVFSGATATPLYVMTGATPQGRFGISSAALGDVNFDTVPDMVIGSSGTPPQMGAGTFPVGHVEVRSGANGSFIYALYGVFNADQFGYAVANAGDVDGDGRSDIAVGAPAIYGNSPNSVGRVTVFSSGTGSPLATWIGPTGNGALGTSLATGGDLDGDGLGDFVAGAPGCILATPPGIVMARSLIGVGFGLVRFGAACGGTGGFAPSIAASGGLPMVGNSSFGFAVTRGLGGAAAFLFASATAAPSGFPIGGGCSAYLAGSFFQLGPTLALSGPTGVGGAGHAVMPVPVPPDVGLTGLSFFFEWAILDAGGPTGAVSLSDALAVTIF